MCQAGIIFLFILSIASSTPKYTNIKNGSNLIGQSTKIITTAMLQEYEESASNLVFSPFGYSTILAILEEGSSGKTEQQIRDVLKISKENTRLGYKEILTSIKEKYTWNIPQLRTWFYVYKNFSVDKDYKRTVLEYYLTEVKNVYPHEFEKEDIQKMDNTQSNTAPEQKTPAIGLAEDEGNSAYEEKDIISKAEKANVKVILTDDSNSFGDGHKNSNLLKRKYVEKREPINYPSQSITERNEQMHKNNEKGDLVRSGESVENEDIHNAKDEGIHFDNVLSLLKKKEGKSMERVESLIIFNGLYFEGNWDIPFEKESIKDFRLGENMSIETQIIKASGVFKTGVYPHIESSAISIPYQGGRYSLVILLPNRCNGLQSLVKHINGTILQDVLDNLQEKEVDVEIPIFEIESTTKPEASLIKIGVDTLFGKGAELTKISKEVSLHAEEIVQLVTMKVTKGISSTNFMTASSVTSRSTKEKFYATHPFLFFIEDHFYNLTMVAGKVLSPTGAV